MHIDACSIANVIDALHLHKSFKSTAPRGNRAKLASIFDPNPNEANGEPHQVLPRPFLPYNWEAQWLLWMVWGGKGAVFTPTFDLWVTFNYLCCLFMAPIPLSDKEVLRDSWKMILGWFPTNQIC